MSLKSAQAMTVDFTTSASTGAATDADSTPTAVLVVNGTDNGATVTVTKKSTGCYKAAWTNPSLTAGDVLCLDVSATIASVACKASLYLGVADTLRLSDLEDSTDLVAAIYNALLATYNATGSFGEAIAAAKTGADHMQADFTSAIAGRIDAAISTRLATAGYTAPLTAAGTRTALGMASANLDTQLSVLSELVNWDFGKLEKVDDGGGLYHFNLYDHATPATLLGHFHYDDNLKIKYEFTPAP